MQTPKKVNGWVLRGGTSYPVWDLNNDVSAAIIAKANPKAELGPWQPHTIFTLELSANDSWCKVGGPWNDYERAVAQAERWLREYVHVTPKKE